MERETKTCPDCGIEKSIEDFSKYVSKHKSGTYEYRRLRCRACHKEKFKDALAKSNKKLYDKAIEDGEPMWKVRRFSSPISYYVTSMMSAIKTRSRKRGADTDISREWLAEKIEAGKCEVTGLPFDMTGDDKGGKSKSPWAPSIDRIDNEGDYTMDNVQVVVWAYNLAKGELNKGEFDTLVRALAKTVINPLESYFAPSIIS